MILFKNCETEECCFSFQEAYERGVNAQQIPAIARPEGILKATYEENRREIVNHEETTVHQSIVRRILEESRLTEEDLTPLLLAKESPRLLITNRYTFSLSFHRVFSS